MFWREKISAVGVDWFSSAICQATTVSAPSAGRSTSMLGCPARLCTFSSSRICASCSTGWWVGPSSPTRNASCDQTNLTGNSINADSRTAGFMKSENTKKVAHTGITPPCSAIPLESAAIVSSDTPTCRN